MIGRHRATLVVQHARTRATNALERLDAQRKGAQELPEAHINYRYRHLLMPEYLDYVARVSWADHAVSLGTAAVIAELCDKRRPARVLDTGSGFSSYVLRRYAREHGAQVVSVDDNADWLGKTAAYLDGHNLGELGTLTTWEAMNAKWPAPFDLIFHDMGNLECRVETMRSVDSLISPSGLVIYDDVIYPAIKAEAKRLCAEKGRRYFTLRNLTLDRAGRFSALSLPPH